MSRRRILIAASFGAVTLFVLTGAWICGPVARDRIATRLSEAARRPIAIKRGFWPGGGVPLGYRLERRADFDGTGKRDATVKIVPEAAALVRRIFQLRIEFGLGYKTIARRLNDDDKRTQRGSLWTATSIKSILDNPAYKGDLVRGRKGFKSKFYVGNESGPEAIGEPGAKVGYEIKDYFPVIVDRETWDAGQRVARERRKKFAARRARLRPPTLMTPTSSPTRPRIR